MAEEAKNTGNKPVWDVVEEWLRAKDGRIAARKVNMPKLTGALPNAGYVDA